MLRTFIQERAEKWDELMQIDTESEKVKIYWIPIFGILHHSRRNGL